MNGIKGVVCFFKKKKILQVLFFFQSQTNLLVGLQKSLSNPSFQSEGTQPQGHSQETKRLSSCSRFSSRAQFSSFSIRSTCASSMRWQQQRLVVFRASRSVPSACSRPRQASHLLPTIFLQVKSRSRMIMAASPSFILKILRGLLSSRWCRHAYDNTSITQVDDSQRASFPQDAHTVLFPPQ